MSHEPDVRKTVTVIFTDIAGWTSLGEGLDPESLRRVMSRYFDEMRRIIERHGGRVEKFIGDAIMAVFGIPSLREDDALRAVRAATDMRAQLRKLNEDLERDHGVQIQIRTGVNTGEVVVGAHLTDTLATGEAVTVAARLEQTAAPGEILIGEPTHALVKDAVAAEDAGDLALKGKSSLIRAWRLIDVRPETPGLARWLGSPLVGRVRELGVLGQAMDRAIAECTCQVVTLVAEAGVGKSRLAAEFMRGVENTVTVARGRCLPYGEGVTFWPIADVIKQLSGIDIEDEAAEAIAKIQAPLAGDPDAQTISDHVAAVAGWSAAVYPVQETFWAIRRFFESIAQKGPILVAFDDIHWGEATFLDFVEYLSGWSTTCPILLLCAARPELLDARGGWGTGGANVGSLRLAPLTPEESRLVLENLAAGADLQADVHARISEVAEGNPLFVQEIFRMLVDKGLLVHVNGRLVPVGELDSIAIPPTVNALLDARLEGIPLEERAVLQRASVMGKLFSWTAIADLSPKADRPFVGAHLQSLVRRAMIHPTPAEFAGEDGFAFSHILIRDAAYRSVAKETRATLHRRFARWLEAKVGDDPAESDEVIGYHLEQAFQYHSELGPIAERDRQIARQGATRLAAAGNRAFDKNDIPATINLLSRAVALLEDDDPLRIEIAPDLGAALSEHGDLKQAGEVFAEACARAQAYGDARLIAHAVLQRWFASEDTYDTDLRRDAERALVTFEAADDDRGISRALRALGDVQFQAGRVGERDVLLERALEHARRAGDTREIGEIQHTICVDLNLGPTPALEGIRRCEELLAEGTGGRAVAGSVFHALAHLRAMRGEFDKALVLAERFRGILRDNGAMSGFWFFAEAPFNVEMLAGRRQHAVDILTEADLHLSQMGDSNPLIAALLSQGLYAIGDFDEARKRAEEAQAAGGSAAMGWRQQARSVLAKLRAREGEHREAEVMARGVVAYFQATDFLIDHGVALMDLGEVLDLSGRPEEAAASVRNAINLFARKGDIVSAANARRTHERLVGY